MKWYYNLKVSAKLLIGFCIIAIIAGLIGYEGISSLEIVHEEDIILYEKNTVALGVLGDISTQFHKQRANVLEAIISTDPSIKADQIKRIAERDADIDKLIPEYEKTYIDDSDRKMFEEWITSFRAFETVRDQVVELAKQNNTESALALYRGEMEKARNLTQELTEKIDEFNIKAAKERAESNTEHAESSISLMMVLIASGMVISVVLGIFISRIISRPINQLVSAMDRFAKGEMNIEVDVKSSDEIGVLAKSFNMMIDKISEQLQYLDNLPTPVMIINKEFGIQYMNKSGATLLGRNQQELVGQKCYDQFKTGDCKTEKCSCTQAMNRNISKTEETTANINGKNVPIMYTGAPIKDKSGNIIGALEFVTDITEIKNAQNYLTNKTDEMLNVMNLFAKGDLTVELDVEKDDQIGKLFDGFNKSVKNINSLVNNLTEAVQATASASNQISSSTEELAAGAQEQSSQSQEIAGAITQMTSTIMETSKHANTASENAKNAGSIAKEGGKVVQETVEGMNRVAEVVSRAAVTVKELGKGSDQIGEIVQVIDDIADQTNLLALNAAIEAARAGEQGRGFAVVADEVRKLAERTTKATKEIATMIKQIQKDTGEAVISMDAGTKEVEKGKELAAKAGESLDQIIKAAEQVVDVINQVAAASEEQSSTSEQITRNIESISNVTHEAASGTQQIARAAEDLNRLTSNLQELITQFKIDEYERGNIKTTGSLAVRRNGKLIGR